MTVLTNFGPAFKIHLKVKVNAFPSETEDEWAQVFTITNGGNDLASGGRYPALFLHRDHEFQFNIYRNGQVYQFNYGSLRNVNINNDYDIVIIQKLIEGKWMFQTFIDGVLIKSKETDNPIQIENAKVLFSHAWKTPANVDVTYLKIEY